MTIKMCCFSFWNPICCCCCTTIYPVYPETGLSNLQTDKPNKIEVSLSDRVKIAKDDHLQNTTKLKNPKRHVKVEVILSEPQDTISKKNKHKNYSQEIVSIKTILKSENL